MPSPIFIGLGHYSNVGKDSYANFLVEALEQYKVSALKISFAYKLKAICHDLYAWAGLQDAEYYEVHRDQRDVVLPELGKTPIEIWVDFGTKAVRKKVYDYTWINYVLRRTYHHHVVIIPDVRFENEIDAIRDKDGVVFKIERPGVKPRDTEADMALVNYDKWDMVIVGRALDDLQCDAEKTAQVVARSILVSEYQETPK